MANFEGEKSSNDIIVNATMSDNEVVALNVPSRYLFLFLLVSACKNSYNYPGAKSAEKSMVSYHNFLFIAGTLTR